MDNNTAVVVAAAVGGAAGIGGTLIAEPVRAWVRRRAEERTAVAQLAHMSMTMLLQLRVLHATGRRNKPDRDKWLEVLLEAHTAAMAAQGALLISGRKRVADASSPLLDRSRELVEAASTMPLDEDAVDKAQYRLGRSRIEFIKTVRPQWRRQPTVLTARRDET